MTAKPLRAIFLVIFFIFTTLLFLAIKMGHTKNGFFGFKIYQVNSTSMLPTIKGGTFLIVKIEKNPKPGDIILFRHPLTGSIMVKRIEQIHTTPNETEKFYVSGDNRRNSLDSRAFGAISEDSLLAVAKISIYLSRSYPFVSTTSLKSNTQYSD